MSEIDLLRKSNNKDVYPTTKLDSVQAIASITKQKLQELYDISALYAYGDKNTPIDTLNYNQIQGYFLKKDSANIDKLIQELDSLKVKNVKVKNIEIESNIKDKDTFNYAIYNVEYRNEEQKLIGEFHKKSQYKLQKSPTKFKKEFKYYFVEVGLVPNDSISVGNIK